MIAMRSFVFFLLAVLFLGSAAYLGNKYLLDPAESINSAPPPAAQAPEIWALRLVKDVDRGDILKKGEVEWHLLRGGRAEDHLLIRKKTDLTDWQGAAYTRSLKKNTFLQDTYLVRPSEAEYLKTLLVDGMRARPVAVHNLSDFENLRPGDYVDLVLTYVTPAHAAQAGETVVKTIVENNRIVAVEEAPVSKAINAKRSLETLTLALSPTDVELVSVAETIGKLRISLRGGSGGKKFLGASKKATFSASDLFPDLKHAPPAAVQVYSRDVRIMRGGETSVVTLSPATGK